MKSFQKHCAELVQFFGSLADYRGYEGAENVSTWLNLAACIKSIDYDTSYFDPGAGVCGMADEWGERQSILQKKIITELTRFQCCWSSLEAAVDSFVHMENPPRGKINQLCAFLKENYLSNETPLGYLDLTDYIQQRVNASENEQPLFRQVDNMPNFLSKHGYGVYCVYKLRNEIAHGAFNIPVDSGNGDNGVLADIIASSRIVLLTLHMLMIARYPEDYIEVFWKKHITVGIPFEVYLRSIHIDDESYLVDIDLDEWS
ncbi:hypothetical protein [Vibrio sp. St2]|uniref:hypothetical protein n=1 Tax=Vibrio sp. St2 TaxID=2853441 RepID=UPI00248E901D|nr:hypothetical protein [Vibrio sp. St2]